MNNQNQNYGGPVEPNTPVQPTGMPSNFVQPNMAYPQQPNMNYNQMPDNNKKSNKTLWIVLGIIAVAAIAIVAILFLTKDKKEEVTPTRPEPSMNRTIMIYMDGSDLEANGHATAELAHIKPANIDLKNNNIIMIAGGAKVWNNDVISAQETSLYQLTENGFVKIKVDSLKNMGEPSTLSSFLKEMYNDYPAKKYDLIFWDHGSGALGLESDDIYGDLLFLNELEQAFDDSPFKGTNKLEAVLFINCLVGNLQIASIMDEYADYMIASEEVSYTSPLIDKFKFLEEIRVEDTGYDFGKKFIDNLINNSNIVAMAAYQNTPTTYAIIDLSKIAQVESDLNKFAQAINVNQSYGTLAYARANMFQYGAVEPAYDMIDLYTFISNVQNLAPSEATNLMTSINNAVVYNYASDQQSKGISVYFPYKGEKQYVDLHVNLLSRVKNANNNTYLSFIKNFDLYKTTNNSYFMDVTSNPVNTVGNDYSMQLSDSQKKNFAKASYLIVKETSSGKFLPVYFSDNTKIDSNGKLKANFDGKIVTVTNNDTKKSEPIVVYELANGNYRTTAQVYEKKDEKTDVNVYMSFKGGKGTINSIMKQANITEEGVYQPEMSNLILDKYTYIDFTNQEYTLTDSKGYIMNEWKPGSYFVTPSLVKNYKIEKTELNKKEKYYFAFQVYDLSNEVTYSQLVQIK